MTERGAVAWELWDVGSMTIEKLQLTRLASFCSPHRSLVRGG